METKKRYLVTRSKTESPVEVFDDPDHAKTYADGPAKFMPGYFDVQRMAGVLIREFAPSSASVLIHGAGGGLEIETFARENSDWTFLGIEPAKPMLDAARDRLNEFGGRVSFHHGYADDAPRGPYDAATSLLTLHFLNATDRANTVSEIVSHLKPGAPFVTAHCSFPQGPNEKQTWLMRHREFAIASGLDPDLAEDGRRFIGERLEVLDPEEDRAILSDAGLIEVTQFFSAFTWRGWVGRAA